MLSRRSCFNQVFAKRIIVMDSGNLDARLTWLGENDKVAVPDLVYKHYELDLCVVLVASL